MVQVKITIGKDQLCEAVRYFLKGEWSLNIGDMVVSDVVTLLENPNDYKSPTLFTFTIKNGNDGPANTSQTDPPPS